MHQPPYCTVDDLTGFGLLTRQELLDLTDEDRLGVVGVDVFDRAAEGAAAQIDTALAGRAPVPLAQVPASVRWIAAVITRYNLYREPPQKVVDAYRAALDALSGLAEDPARLLDEPPMIAPASDSPSWVVTAPMFDLSGLGG